MTSESLQGWEFEEFELSSVVRLSLGSSENSMSLSLLRIYLYGLVWIDAWQGWELEE